MSIMQQNQLSELNSLVKAIFTIQLTSVENERGFSKVNKIQNKFTNKILPKNLYQRVLINTEKIPADQFDFNFALRLFFEAKKRNGKFREAFREISEQ